MTTHTLWQSNLLVKDNFLPEELFWQVQDYVYDEYHRQQKYPMLEFNHKDVPEELFAWKQLTYNAFFDYAAAAELSPDMFDWTNLQASWIEKYNAKYHNEHIMEPHHDLAEAGHTAIVYYVDGELSTEEKFVGGELAIYKALTYAEYPEGIMHVRPVPNRLIMFPALLYHRVKPYFGDKPRVALAALLNKERGHNQNQIIRTI